MNQNCTIKYRLHTHSMKNKNMDKNKQQSYKAIIHPSKTIIQSTARIWISASTPGGLGRACPPGGRAVPAPALPPRPCRWSRILGSATNWSWGPLVSGEKRKYWYRMLQRWLQTVEWIIKGRSLPKWLKLQRSCPNATWSSVPSWCWHLCASTGIPVLQLSEL